MRARHLLALAAVLLMIGCSAGTPAPTSDPVVPQSSAAVDELVGSEGSTESSVHSDDASTAEDVESGPEDPTAVEGGEGHAEESGAVEGEESHADGHDDDTISTTPPDETVGRVVHVVLTDFAIELDATTFEAGETVTFEVVNEGAIEHELRLSNAHRIEEHIESGHEGHGDGGDGHHEGEADVFIHLESGESGTLVVTFPEDVGMFTEAACLIPGHYEAGMRTDIEVAV